MVTAGRLNSPVHPTGLGSVLNRDPQWSREKERKETEGEMSGEGVRSEERESGEGVQSDGVKGEGGATKSSNSHASPPPTVTHLSETTPTPEQPTIPLRPYRPLRPFPPPSGSEKKRTSSSPSPSHSTGSKHGKRTHKTHHGDPRFV